MRATKKVLCRRSLEEQRCGRFVVNCVRYANKPVFCVVVKAGAAPAPEFISMTRAPMRRIRILFPIKHTGALPIHALTLLAAAL